MKQLTAVERLIKELRKNRIVIPMAMEQQAKTMEKKQSIAFGYRCIGEVDSELGDLIYKKLPEEIYNETFKSE